jgi:small subunit ribosomal protein S20
VLGWENLQDHTTRLADFQILPCQPEPRGLNINVWYSTIHVKPSSKLKECIVANHKSAAKRARQAIIRTERNKQSKTRTKTVVKQIREAIAQSDKKTASELLPKAQSYLYRLAKTGVIKQNTAGRKTARLAKQVQALA